MRPVAVLILVLGAVAALVFAIASISSDSRSAQAVTRTVVQRAEGTAQPAVLMNPDQEVDPAEPLEAPVRRALDEGNPTWKNGISGRVVSVQQAPIQGATVSLIQFDDYTELAELSRAMEESDPPAPVKELLTGSDGEFLFRGLDPSVAWGLIVSHPDYSRAQAGPIEVREEGTAEELVELRTGFQLFGYVTDATTGQAIAGAHMLLEDPMTGFLPRNKKHMKRQAVYTDDTGHYEFINVPPGSRTLSVEAEGYAMRLYTNVRFMGTDDLRIQQDCELKIGMMIAGRVLAADGSGIVGAEVQAVSHQAENASRGGTLTKAGGEFVIEDIGSGLYTLRVNAQGWDIDPVPRIEAGETNVEIRATERGGVMGVVFEQSSGEPMDSFQCIVRAVHPTNNAYGVVAARKRFKNRSDGSFSIDGVSPGEYVIQADADGYASTFSTPFHVRQGETTPDVRIELSQGSTLKGRVLDSESGDPVAGAEISTNENNWFDSEFTKLLGGMDQTAMTVAKVKTDEDGYFEIKLMLPSEYQVRVKHAKYTEFIKNDVTLTDGQTNDIGTVLLSKGAVLRGTVYGPEGIAAHGCDIYLNAIDGRMFGGNRQARSDANGRFLIRNVSAGDYRLSAARPQNKQSGGPFGQIVDMKNSEVEVSLFDGHEVTTDLYLGQN